MNWISSNIDRIVSLTISHAWLTLAPTILGLIVALSALFVMMKNAHVGAPIYKRNVVVGVVAMGYSVFAIYASGKDAVLGGMLVLAVAYVIWGFLATRFNTVAAATAAAGGKV